MLRAVVVLFLLINVVAFAVMGFDKLSARRQVRRVREATLLKFAAFGGCVGVFAGAAAFRHKTVKTPFRRKLWLVSLLNLLWIWLAWMTLHA